MLEEGVPGQDLTLTIDASLQVAVEQELLSAWIADRAKAASAVVMDPYTGEVYAYASYPSYDANAYQAIATNDPARFVDPIVSTVYEPGSVFKMLTAIAALGDGTVTTTTKIKDTGALVLDGGHARVDDADHKAHGHDDVRGRHRLLAQRGRRQGRADARQDDRQGVADAVRGRGAGWASGTSTGIDVANEVPGHRQRPGVRPWRQIDLANGAFGQGVAVTPIQLAQAYAAMVNGGTLVQPRVVKSVGNARPQPVSRGRVISPELSTTLQDLMKHVVTEVDFYRTRTLIPGFEVGGKTGTAQIWDTARNAWKVNLFNYSFIGYIGREKGHPDLVVAVRIEEGTPTVVRHGHLEMPVMSFELFRRIAHDAITRPTSSRNDATVTPATAASP